MFFGWFTASFCLLWLIYGLYEVQLSPINGAAYSSLSHSLWAMSLAWIVVACSCGYGGYVNKLLSAPCIYPFSRVTYCAYLVHPIAIRILALNSDAPLHLGADSMVCIWNINPLRDHFLIKNFFFFTAGRHILRSNGVVLFAVVHGFAIFRSTSRDHAQNSVTKSKEAHSLKTNFNLYLRFIIYIYDIMTYIYISTQNYYYIHIMI